MIFVEAFVQKKSSPVVAEKHMFTEYTNKFFFIIHIMFRLGMLLSKTKIKCS